MERALKKVIRNRKNALFCKTLNGAGVGDLFRSLIHFCELNKANPVDYLTELQKDSAELKQKASAWMPLELPRDAGATRHDGIRYKMMNAGWPIRIVSAGRNVTRIMAGRWVTEDENRIWFLASHEDWRKGLALVCTPPVHKQSTDHPVADSRRVGVRSPAATGREECARRRS